MVEKESVENLGLKEDKQEYAVVKASDVIAGVD
jgi:molybdopterin-binding protein